jgi:hypothetical protein
MHTFPYTSLCVCVCVCITQAMEDLCNVKEEITKAMPEGERCYKHIVILDIGGIGMKHGSSKVCASVCVCVCEWECV